MARHKLSFITPPLLMPRRQRTPLRLLAERFGAATCIILTVALFTYLDREGYHDATPGQLTLLDSVYYATVTLTTTGYGDIYPASELARAVTAFVVTPLRIVFLVLLVGTTVEILTDSTRQAWRVRRWRHHVHDHLIICGYGAKGCSAVEALVGNGTPRDHIVVIEPDEARADAAMRAGHPVVRDSSTRRRALGEADIHEASSLIVAVDRDDTAVLTVLTARELSPDITITATLREEENAHLLRQSGADVVVPSTSAAGRMVAIATFAPDLVGVIDDLLSVGRGIDLHERAVAPGETTLDGNHRGQVILVLRDGESLLWNDPRAEPLRPGDRLVELVALPATAAPPA